jgi:hypothetical protein
VNEVHALEVAHTAGAAELLTHRFANYRNKNEKSRAHRRISAQVIDTLAAQELE